MESEQLALEALRERLILNTVNLKILFHERVNLDLTGHIIKKNNRRILKNRRTGQSFIGKSSKQIFGENYLTSQLVKSRIKQKLFEPINTPVWCIFLFYFKNYYVKKQKKNEPPRVSSNVGDLSNLYQMPEDCLQEAGIIKDDSLIVSHDMSRKLPSQTGRDYLDIFVIDYFYEDPSRNTINN